MFFDRQPIAGQKIFLRFFGKFCNISACQIVYIYETKKISGQAVRNSGKVREFPIVNNYREQWNTLTKNRKNKIIFGKTIDTRN